MHVIGDKFLTLYQSTILETNLDRIFFFFGELPAEEWSQLVFSAPSLSPQHAQHQNSNLVEPRPPKDSAVLGKVLVVNPQAVL